MKEFNGMLGNWDLNDENEVVSDVGYIVAAIDLVDGTKADAYMLGASKAMFEALQAMLNKAYKQNWNDQYPDEVLRAQEAIKKALGEE